MPRKKKAATPKGFEQLTPIDPSYGAFTTGPVPPMRPLQPREPAGIGQWLEADATTWAKPPNIPPEAWATAIQTASQARAEEFAKIDAKIWGPVPPTVPPQCLPTEQSKAEDIEGDGRHAVSHIDHKEDTSGILKDLQDADAIDKQQVGDTLPTSISADGAGITPTREERPNYAVIGRLTAEGRWRDASPVRDQMMIEARARGMTKLEAQLWTYAELDRLYPPLKPVPAPEIVDSAPTSEQVPGLYLVPEMWPTLTDNASLQAELGWVQSQRLAVVEERGNTVVVRLERASCPAPSKAALGWLETSIRSYAKYVDVVARVLTGAQDEQETTRRERMRLDEIRALLDEVHLDK